MASEEPEPDTGVVAPDAVPGVLFPSPPGTARLLVPAAAGLSSLFEMDWGVRKKTRKYGSLSDGADEKGSQGRDGDR